MPKDLTDVDTFTDPVSVPVDADARNALSVEVPFQALANRTFFLNQFVASEEWTYKTPKTRIRKLDALNGIFKAPASTNDNLLWHPLVQGTEPTRGFVLRSEEDAVELHFPLLWFLPPSATVTKIRVLVTPGASRSLRSGGPATSGDGGRMFIATYSPSFDFTTPAVSYVSAVLEEDDGSAAIFVIDSGTISLPVVSKAGPTHVLRVVSGSDSGTNKDLVHAVELTYTDVGPRNL